MPVNSLTTKTLVPLAAAAIALVLLLMGWRYYSAEIIDITAVNSRQQIAQVVWSRSFPAGAASELQIKDGVAASAEVLCRIPLLATSEEDQIYREYRAIRWLDDNRVSLEVNRNGQLAEISISLATTPECTNSQQ